MYSARVLNCLYTNLYIEIGIEYFLFELYNFYYKQGIFSNDFKNQILKYPKQFELLIMYEILKITV